MHRIALHFSGAVCASVLVQRSPDKPRTTRCLVLLVVAAALPLTLIKYGLLGRLAGALSLLLPVAALAPLVAHSTYPPPAGNVAFSCPFVPWVPLAGVLLNVYLSVELSVFAWIRLLVVWAALVAYYVYSEAHYHKHGKERGRGCRPSHMEKEGSVVMGAASPSDSLRRRSSRHSTGSGAGGGQQHFLPSLDGAAPGAAGAGAGGSGPSSPLRRPLIPSSLAWDGAAGEDMV